MIFAFLSARLRAFVLSAVALPIAGKVARFVGGRVEQRRGQDSKIARGLLWVARRLGQERREAEQDAEEHRRRLRRRRGSDSGA